MSEIPTIGDVVREWRQERQISLTDFCQQTKLSKGYVSELEHNKIDNPKMDKLEILARALGIEVMDIISRRMPLVDGQATAISDSLQGGEDSQKGTSQSTVYHAPVVIKRQRVMMHQIRVLEKKLEAVEKNLRTVKEDLRELGALAKAIFREE